MKDNVDSRRKHYNELLEKAKWGVISDEEVLFVAQEIENGHEVYPYTLLHTLGRGGEQIICRGGKLPSSYVHIVDRFLRGQEDTLARLAWWILASWWEMAEYYVADMFEYIQGPSWPAEEARWAAFRAAGRYLTSHTNPELLQAIINVFENKEESPNVRQAAYYALSEMLGHDLSKLPPFYENIDLDHPPDFPMLPEAKERFTRESSLHTAVNNSYKKHRS